MEDTPKTLCPAPAPADLAALLALYLLLAGIVLYLVLKRMDKREWMWLGVPVLAVLAALGVLCSVVGTFFVKTKEGASQKNLLRTPIKAQTSKIKRIHHSRILS